MECNPLDIIGYGVPSPTIYIIVMFAILIISNVIRGVEIKSYERKYNIKFDGVFSEESIIFKSINMPLIYLGALIWPTVLNLIIAITIVSVMIALCLGVILIIVKSISYLIVKIIAKLGGY